MDGEEPEVFSESPSLVTRLQELHILPPPGEGPGCVRRILFHVVLVTVVATGLGILLLLKDLGVWTQSSRKIESILSWQRADNSIVYDRNGTKIAEVFNNYHIYYRYAKLPQELIDALIAIEDRTFWQHRGIDMRGIARAAISHLRDNPTRFRQGASTLTQQLVRHFLLPQEKTIARKVWEIFLALELEKQAPKTKILELYANSLFLGSGAHGVGAAAYRYFGKPLERLRLHELALIAGLFQSPSLYNPHRFPQRAKTRQMLVLNAMVAAGYLPTDERDRWAKEPLEFKEYMPLYGTVAPYFVDHVQEEARKLLGGKNIKSKGLRIYTTLDRELQDIAENALIKSGSLLQHAERRIIQNKNDAQADRIEAAILATDPQTGEILAMVGGRDYKESKFNRTTQALRQPGSAFKPIVYSLALQQGYKWSDLIYVSPVTLAGNYRPRNHSGDYLTETTLLRAFFRSMNSPTLQIGEHLGIKNVINQATNLGITTPIKEEFGTVLGASETTIMDLATVYGAFASKGWVRPPFGIMLIKDVDNNVLYDRTKQTGREFQGITEQLAFLMVQGMRQVLIRGTGADAAEFAEWAAGKTGTSNDSADNWFNGFTTNLVCSVWVGSDQHSPIGEPAGGNVLALPVWSRFMEKALKLRKPEPWTIPSDVVTARIDPVHGQITDNGMQMWFLHNRVPTKAESPFENLSETANIRDPFATGQKF